jgi:hypothetical protein
MQPSPLKLIVLGAGGVVLFGAVGVSFYASSGEYASSDVERVAGTVAEVRDLDQGGGSRGLEVRLSDESLPFRSSGTYPDAFSQDALRYVVPGAQVAIEIDSKERSSPRFSWAEGQKFRNILSLKVGDRVALSQENYNAWSRENREIGKIMLPVFFGLALACLAGGLLWRRAERAGRAGRTR